MKKTVVQWLSIPFMSVLLLACSSERTSVYANTAQDDESFSGPEATIVRRSQPVVDYKPIQSVSSEARNSVLFAYEAKRAKQWELLPALASEAQQDHELGAYPMYWYLRYQLSQNTIPSFALQTFVSQYPRTYVSARLKAEWAVASAKEGDIRTVLLLGEPKIKHAAAQCAFYEAQALSKIKVDKAIILKSVKDNERCWSMLASLKNLGIINLRDLRDNFRAAVEYDNKSMAYAYARLFFNTEDVVQFGTIMQNPLRWLTTQSGKSHSEAQEELRTLAFSRLARQDREQGIQILKQRGKELLTSHNQEWAYTQFALVSILNQEGRADEWYRLGKKVHLSQYNAAWRVRAALRQTSIDWKWVEKTINLMSPEQQQESAWVYWKARALKAQGKAKLANALLATLNRHYDFYGQLAQEELHGKLLLPEEPEPVTTEELAHIQQNTGLQKAVALFDLGWRAEAVAEWNYAIQGLNDRDLLAAAAWAEQKQIYDRVINTSMQTRQLVSFKQRFVAPFEGKVEAQAHKVGIDPSWVYGLIRQESRFVPVARSSVGASGLMQLMPGTARLVARKIGLSDFSLSQVNEFEMNTLLGTNYLRMTLDNLGGNEILATAGYNAGPNRSKRWRASLLRPIEGAIFAETIPFTETRLYVKHVLSNAVWYDAMFHQGKVKSLKKRLGMVTP